MGPRIATDLKVCCQGQCTGLTALDRWAARRVGCEVLGQAGEEPDPLILVAMGPGPRRRLRRIPQADGLGQFPR
jgi:hypothetical protein